MLVLAQICGLLSGISNIISSWQYQRKNMLIFLLFDNTFYFLQYILLGALSGAIISVVNFFRTLLFINKNKYSNNSILIVFIIIYLIIGILTFENYYSLIPTIISIFYAPVLWQNNVVHIKKGTIIMLLSWALYNFYVHAYISGIIEIILTMSNILALYKLNLKK